MIKINYTIKNKNKKIFGVQSKNNEKKSGENVMGWGEVEEEDLNKKTRYDNILV